MHKYQSMVSISIALTIFLPIIIWLDRKNIINCNKWKLNWKKNCWTSWPNILRSKQLEMHFLSLINLARNEHQLSRYWRIDQFHFLRKAFLHSEQTSSLNCQMSSMTHACCSRIFVEHASEFLWANQPQPQLYILITWRKTIKKLNLMWTNVDECDNRLRGQIYVTKPCLKLVSSYYNAVNYLKLKL